MQGRGPSSLIHAIDGCGGGAEGDGPGAPLLATAGLDGAVHVWDPRLPVPVASLPTVQAPPVAAAGTQGAPSPSVGAAEKPLQAWGVAFGNAHSEAERWVAAGYEGGTVRIFDLRAGRVMWEEAGRGGGGGGKGGGGGGGARGWGVNSLEFDRRDTPANRLLAARTDGRVRVWDLRTRHPAEGFAGVSERAHQGAAWAGHHMPQNRDVFVTTGGNGGFNLYR